VVREVRGVAVDEAEAVGLGERVLELVGGQVAGEVDERALHGGDADAPPDADLVRAQRSALVGVDAGTVTAALREGDVDRSGLLIADAVERGGAVVTDHGLGAAGELRRHRAPLQAYVAVADGEDAAVEADPAP